jgi:hypothetical protein
MPLHDVFRVVRVTHQPPRQSVRGIEVRQDDVLEARSDRRPCGL